MDICATLVRVKPTCLDNPAGHKYERGLAGPHEVSTFIGEQYTLLIGHNSFPDLPPSFNGSLRTAHVTPVYPSALELDHVAGALPGKFPRSSDSQSQGKAGQPPTLAGSPGFATPSSR
jgi:hypothetical protein